MIYYSDIQPVYFLLPLVGFIIGLFGSMLGGGGGFFFLPILTLALNVPAQTAVTTSLVATLPICVAGTASHYTKSNVNLQIAALFGLSGIVGSFVGAGIANRVDASQLKLAFGAYSVLMAIQIAIKTQKKQAEKRLLNPISASGITKNSFFGLVAGIITGVFGTSGTAPVLAGLFSMRLPFKVVVGTSLFIVLINTVAAIGFHFIVGKIDLTLITFLTIGSVFGAFIGPKLLSDINITPKESKLKYSYALVMLVIGVLMIINSLNA